MTLDANEAVELSPLRRIPPHGPSLIVAWGGRELEEFQRQIHEFATAWQAAGGELEEIVMPEHNHFDMTTELSRAGSPLLVPFIELIARSA